LCWQGATSDQTSLSQHTKDRLKQCAAVLIFVFHAQKCKTMNALFFNPKQTRVKKKNEEGSSFDWHKKWGCNIPMSDG
jgi:hypothetical protein